MTLGNPIDFVIVGFPRSGFRYTAKVLTKLGVLAGHERSFGFNKQHCHSDNAAVWGDLSWLATPYISQLPPSTKVLWQTRDPIKSLDSSFAHDGSLVGAERIESPYAQFVLRHIPDLQGETEKERMLYWYIAWHDMVIKYDYAYKVEDLSDPKGVILDVCRLTGASAKAKDVERALSQVSTSVHHRPTDDVVAPWTEEYLRNNNTEASRRVIEIIDQLGYQREEK